MYRIMSFHGAELVGTSCLYSSLDHATEEAIKADHDHPEILHLVRDEKRRAVALELA